MVIVRNLTKRYGEHTAVDDLSIEIPSGQVVGLLGENGAGKTTLLNMLSGYMAPSTGDLCVNGHNLLTEPLLARQSIGYMPEHVPLYPELTVDEYLQFCCSIRNVPDSDNKAYRNEAAQLAGVAHVLNKRISTLSKGYRQRVGFAQALCARPQLLLLDEPTAGFDPAQAAEFRQVVRSLAGHHTIIVSSHILSEIEGMCDRVLILKSGYLVYDHFVSEHQIEERNSLCLAVKGDTSGFVSALRSLPSVRKASTMGNVQPDVFTATVVVDDSEQFGRDITCLVSGLGLSLLSLRPAERTLEDIFLSVSQIPPVTGESI